MITLTELVNTLLKYQRDLEILEVEYLDVRLQIVDGTFFIHHGDPQYDTDHRGVWGYGYVDSDMTIDAITDVAMDMIDEVSMAYVDIEFEI